MNLLGLDKMEENELANVEGNISAMVQIGSVGGAALYVNPFAHSFNFSNISTELSSSVIVLVVFGLPDNFVSSGYWA